MPTWDSAKPWYHGSPLRLEVLRAGSTITQDRELARVFSHEPTAVAQIFEDDERRSLRHTGSRPGYLYRVAEEVKPGDVYPHPQSTMGPGREWLTRRELRVELLERTEVLEGERLTPEEAARLRARE